MRYEDEELFTCVYRDSKTPKNTIPFKDKVDCAVRIGFVDEAYPSAGGRLFGIGGMIEGWGFRFRRVMGSVHKLDYGHKFAGAASAPVVARGAEAGDCCGLAGAGVIGIGGGTALRRECEPGFCVAQALSRTGQHSGSSATGAGDGDAGSAVRALTGVNERVDRN